MAVLRFNCAVVIVTMMTLNLLRTVCGRVVLPILPDNEWELKEAEDTEKQKTLASKNNGALCGVPDVEPRASLLNDSVEATPHSWPWTCMVACAVDPVYKCACSIISDRVVITYNLCFLFSSCPQWRVITGKHDQGQVETTEQVYWNEHMVIHSFGFHKVALLVLNTTIEFNDVVKPVCLATEALTAGSVCTAVGWYSRDENDDNFRPLKQIDLPIMEHAKCVDSLRGKRLTSFGVGTFCAGYETGVNGTCSVDWGSPLVCRNPISGVWALHGFFVGNTFWKSRPYVFASIMHYAEYINRMIYYWTGTALQY